MRLWHQELISALPGPQLLGQHRECCALRGGGWGRKHSIVDYVFTHPPFRLFQYHALIMNEMTERGYNVDPLWQEPEYRGRKVAAHPKLEELDTPIPLYAEHNNEYLEECLENLRGKGIKIENIEEKWVFKPTKRQATTVVSRVKRLKIELEESVKEEQ